MNGPLPLGQIEVHESRRQQNCDGGSSVNRDARAGKRARPPRADEESVIDTAKGHSRHALPD